MKTTVKITFPGIYFAPFCSSKLVYFFKFSFREKSVLSFALLDEWNVNNSIEKVKGDFWIVFHAEE